MKKTYGIIIALSVWAVVGVSSSRAEVINRIVATVDGEPITLHELRAFARRAGPGGLLMEQGGGAGVTDQDLLEAVIMKKLVSKEVEAQGLQAREADIDGYIERIKSQGNLDDEQLVAALADQGLTIESYRRQIAEEIEQALLVNREIGSRVNVTPEDIERYYNEHVEEYTHPDQVRVRHIFLPLSPAAMSEEEQKTLGLIQNIRDRALEGEDFAALASTYSLGPGAEQGGDLGYFKRGEMNEEIEAVAFQLEPGDISQPFRTNAGVHLIKVEERHSSGREPIESVSDEIKQKLYNEALRERYRRWFQEDLRFRHHIENFLASPSGTYQSVRSPSLGVSDPSEDTSSGESALATDEQPEEKEKGFFRRLLPF